MSLGFGFVPTPRYNAFNTRIDLFKLIRQLKLRCFFGERAGTEGNTFNPNPNIINHDIQTFERVVLRDITALERNKSKTYYNIFLAEKQALTDLVEDQSIIIKQADKGGWGGDP